jgi:trypsin
MKFSSIVVASLLQIVTLTAADEQHIRRRLQGHRHENKHIQPRDHSNKHDLITHFQLLGGDGSGIESRIVGGDQSAPGEFPYYVDLNGCGGSLIAPDVVLTAAHCGSFEGDTVIVGAFRAGSTQNNAVSVSVVDEAMHPNYNDDTMVNDFLLLKLSEPVNIPGSNVVLSLNDQFSNPADGDDLTVLGLGKTSEGGSSPSILRDVEVQAIDTNICNQPAAYGGDVINTNMFCAGVNNGGKDSCQGDSGGPIVKRVGNQHIQVGVVSWGAGCARENLPGVYARVSNAYNWIDQVVCDQWGSDASFCTGGGGGPNPTPPPTPTNGGGGGGGGNCPSGKMEFDFTIRTDDYGYETSWEVINSSGSAVVSGSNYDEDESYTKKKCIPDACYTMTIFDSYGDGISEGGSNPGYTLRIDGNVVDEEGGIDFGEQQNIEFGSCSGGGGGSGGDGSGVGDSCVPVTLNLVTDDYGDDTVLFLLADSGELIWNANGFADNKNYQFTTCLDRSECATLDIFDSYGDGIMPPGGTTLTVDGQVEYEGGAIEGGIIFRIGSGC